MSQMPHTRSSVLRCAAVSAILGLVLCSACGSEGSSTSSDVETPRQTTSGTQAIKARYEMTYAEDDQWRAVYDVVTAGEQRARVALTVPVDDPVTRYRWVWDGRRLLEYSNESDPPSYTLCEAPAEEEYLLSSVTGWILDQDSGDFATECRDAQPANATKTIAGRSAIGFRCRTDSGRAALWIDKETNLLLGQSGIPGEGVENGTLWAKRVTLDASINHRTFSTDPPTDAPVHVVKSTGKPAPPPD